MKSRLRMMVVLVTMLFGFAMLVVGSRPLVSALTLENETTTTLSTYYGGSEDECIFTRCSIAIDNSGNIIVAGSTNSDDFPTVNPWSAYVPSQSGEEIFVLKLTPNGEDILFSTLIGGGEAWDVAVDAAGDIYVAGSSFDASFPTTGNAIQACRTNNTQDALVFKLSADGQNLLYASCLGGSGSDTGIGIDADDDGNLVATGYTVSDDFPVKNAVQSERAGQDDLFVARINTNNGNLIYSTYFGGDGRDRPWDLVLDGDNQLFVGGRAESQETFPETPGVVGPDDDRGEAFMLKFAPDGTLGFSTRMGSVTDTAAHVDVDDAGDVYFLWMQVGPEAVGKLSGDGSTLLYKSEVDAEFGTIALIGGLEVDSRGRAYVTGRTNVTNAGKDVVLLALHPGGRTIYRETIGGSDDDEGHNLALFEAENGRISAAIVGTTLSSDFPLQNPIQDSNSGAFDVIIHNVTNLEDVVNVEFLFLPTVLGS